MSLDGSCKIVGQDFLALPKEKEVRDLNTLSSGMYPQYGCCSDTRFYPHVSL
jgi:hypothetical protein